MKEIANIAMRAREISLIKTAVLRQAVKSHLKAKAKSEKE